MTSQSKSWARSQVARRHPGISKARKRVRTSSSTTTADPTEVERLKSDLELFIRDGAFDALSDPKAKEEPPFEDSELEWFPHHTWFCRALELVTEGKIKRLCINAPPGSLKSQIVNVFWPAWELARDQSIQRMVASTNFSNTKRDSMETRDLVKTEWYQDRFDVTVRHDRDGKTDWGSVSGGFYKATSVGSKNVGGHADRLHVDDAVGAREAYSKKRRENNIEWFREEFSDRKNHPKESAVIVIGHRVHEKDLFGELRENDNYEWICVSAKYQADHQESTILANSQDEYERILEEKGYCVGIDAREDGDLLQPGRRDEEDLEQEREDVGSHMFSAKFLQRPKSVEGNLIENDWVVRWESKPSFKDREIIWVIDAKQGSKAKGSSDCVIQLWVGDEDNCFMLDEKYGVWKQTETLQAIEDLWKQQASEFWKGYSSNWWQYADKIIVENKADGPAIKDHLQDEVSIPIVMAQPWAGKTQRVADVSKYFMAGSVEIPSDEVYEDAESFVTQAANFPTSEKDDRIDCASYAVMYYLGNLLELDEVKENKLAKYYGGD